MSPTAVVALDAWNLRRYEKKPARPLREGKLLRAKVLTKGQNAHVSLRPCVLAGSGADPRAPAAKAADLRKESTEMAPKC